MSDRFSVEIHESGDGTTNRTDPTDHKDLGSPAIAIPSEQFLLAGQTGVFSRVLGGACMGWSFGIQRHTGRIRGRAFIVSLKRRSRRLERGLVV